MVRRYFNERASIWDANIAEKDENKLEQMVGRLNVNPGSILLDVGTGTGVFLPFLLSKIGKSGRLVALDFAEKMLRKARAKGFGGNIDYLQANVENIPLPDETFDIITCYSSFPHFQDKPEALREMKRVLKSGGRLLVCHTSSRAEINEIHRQTTIVKDDILPDTAEMRSLLLAAGFNEIIIEDNKDSYLASAEKPKVT